MRQCSLGHALIFHEGRKCPVCSIKQKVGKLMYSLSLSPKTKTEPVEKKPRKPRRKKSEADLPDLDKDNKFYGEKK